MPHETAGSTVMLFLLLVKAAIFILGGVITYFSLKAYRRTGDRSLGLLTAGFAMIVLGAGLGGTAHEVIGTTLATGVVIEGVFAVIGFGLIAYSLRIST